MLKITPCIDYKGSDSLYRGLFPQEQHLLFIAIKLWQEPLDLDPRQLCPRFVATVGLASLILRYDRPS